MALQTLTSVQIKYIKRQYKTVLKKDIAKQLGIKYTTVVNYCRKMGWLMDMNVFVNLRAKANYKPFTKEDDDFIISHLPTSSIKKISKQIHRTQAYVSQRAKELGLEHIIRENAINSRIKKGYVPPNKGKKMTKEQYEKSRPTFFKPGNIPMNAFDRDGVITVRADHKDRTGRKYKWIRVSLGKWELLHIYKWRKYRGEIPPGYCLWYKDGNTLNCTIKNLELITRAENLKRNRERFLDLPPEVKKASMFLKKLNNTINGKKQTKRSV